MVSHNLGNDGSDTVVLPKENGHVDHTPPILTDHLILHNVNDVGWSGCSGEG